MATGQGNNGEGSVRRKGRSWAPIVIGVAVIGIGLAVVGTSTSGGAGMYNYTLAQLSAPGADLQGRDIKVAGKVKVGSVRGEPGSAAFRFDIADTEGHALTIAYTKLLPDPFEEGRDAIIQGRVVPCPSGCAGQTLLQASSLTVKCPSRYGDASSLTPEQQKKYYDTEYRKHLEAQPPK